MTKIWDSIHKKGNFGKKLTEKTHFGHFTLVIFKICQQICPKNLSKSLSKKYVKKSVKKSFKKNLSKNLPKNLFKKSVKKSFKKYVKKSVQIYEFAKKILRLPFSNSQITPNG